MATYNEVSIVGYNANPPEDDGTQASSNEVSWAKHKSKLGDPVKTAIEGTQTAITNLVTEINAELGELNAPSGTRLLFQQTTPPTGWTKDTTHNNKALRITSGSVTTGGSVDFTTAFANRLTTASALSVSQLAEHAHSNGNLQAATHRHGTAARSQFASASVGGGSGNLWQGEVGGLTQFAGPLAISGATSNTGSGSGHNHGLNIDVQYVDVIIAQKD